MLKCSLCKSSKTLILPIFFMFFQKVTILSLPPNGICQYHNMMAFKHLLSANAEYLLFCHLATQHNNFPRLPSPPHYAKCIQDKKCLAKKCFCSEIFWHKNLFSSKMKSTLSFISNYSLHSVSTERCQLPVVMSYIDIYKTALDFVYSGCLPRSVSVSTDTYW